MEMLYNKSYSDSEEFSSKIMLTSSIKNRYTYKKCALLQITCS